MKQEQKMFDLLQTLKEDRATRKLFNIAHPDSIELSSTGTQTAYSSYMLRISVLQSSLSQLPSILSIFPL